MKKIVLISGLVLMSISLAFGATCVDLQNNLTKGKETGEVLALQNFLVQKGFLTAKPNGYFGNGTFLAVKKYQKNVGLSQSGQVFPLTRATIKKETCSSTNSSSTTSTPTSTITTTQKSIVATTTIPVVPQPVVLTPNQQRQQDLNNLLTAMYQYYNDAYKIYPVPTIMSTSSEICAAPIGNCNGYSEVYSSLVPRFLPKILRDPTITGVISSTTPKTGYFILRDSNNDITLTAPSATGGETIMAKCNFNNGCKISTVPEKKKLAIDSIGYPIFLSGGVMDASLIINGAGFTPTSNTVLLTGKISRKTYTLGDFSSATGTMITATTSFTIAKLSCGAGCLEVLPVDDYTVTVKNKDGESNVGYISLKGITAKSFSNGSDVTFRPKTTHMKLGSVTISSEALVTLKTLKFTVTGTSSLVSKITNFTITDTSTDKITNGGPTFTLPSENISSNQTKIYDLYADIADIDNSYAGRISIGGVFTVTDYLGNRTVSVPFSDFMITISY